MRIFASLSLVWIVLVASAPNLQADGWPCSLYLVETHITDNGDGDGFADTNETLWIGISVVPSCDEELHGCVARIQTDSPAIDCMRRPEIYLGDFPAAGPAVESTETFEIKMGYIDRDDLGLAPDDPLVARLTVRWDCEESVSVNYNDNEIDLSLDLNLSDTGQTPVSWFEGFEGGDLGSFAAQNNDAGLPGANDEEGTANADGWRCQYADPEWINSETYGRTDCYPGMNLAQADAVFWQLDGSDVAASPDGGRAKSGSHSMYYGVFIGHVDGGFTTPQSTVEAAGMTEPVNLGTQSPRLSFWHQLSLIDDRRFEITEKTTIDRAVVQIQLTDTADTQPEPWTNLTPAVNTYIPWVEWNLLLCVFDPIDDGNTEDDFWLPTAPNRNRGPSSTCADQAVWSWQGDTSSAPFDVGNVGHATTPPAPGDVPSLGSGTWVRTEVDLTPYRGRRARLRFLVSALKGPTSSETWYEALGSNAELDDGWWIDDILIDETLPDPGLFSNDEFLLGSCSGSGEPCIGQCRLSLAPCSSTAPCGEGEGDCVSPCPPGDVCSGPPPDCGANCSQARMNVFVEPDGPFNPAGVTTSAPGEIVRLNFAAGYDAETGAEPSWVDVCIDGFREYRKCVSGDPDGSGPELPDADCDDAWDSRYFGYYEWSTRSDTGLAPDVVTTYALEVRCSSAPDCRDGRTFEIYVDCPTLNPNTLGLREMRALDRQTLVWHGMLDVDWIRGSFSTGTEIGDYMDDFTDSASGVTSIPMIGEPPAGSGYYYLVKADGPTFPFQVYQCDTVTWRSGGDAEKNEPARNSAFGNPG